MVDGWLLDMYLCDECKNEFWMENLGEDGEGLNDPSFCPCCGMAFIWLEDE